MMTIIEYTRQGRLVAAQDYCDKCGKEVLDAMGVPAQPGWHQYRLGRVRVYIDDRPVACRDCEGVKA